PPPERSLLLRHRSYRLMRQSCGLSSTSVSPRWRSLCRLSTSPCCPPGPSRRYLRESFLGCLILYPGGPTACLYLFLPLCHRPSPQGAWVGFPRVIRLKRLLAGR